MTASRPPRKTFEAIVALQCSACQCGKLRGRKAPVDCAGRAPEPGPPREGASLPEEDDVLMYIVAIGWLYVVLMMAITEHTVVAGVATFVFYGLGPVAILVYIMGTPGRRRRRKAEEAKAEKAAAADAADAAAPADTPAGAAQAPRE